VDLSKDYLVCYVIACRVVDRWLGSFVCRHGDTWHLSGCLRRCVEHETWRSCLLVFLPFRSLNHVFY